MPSYVVTGANRGIGLGLLRKLSEDKDNTVIGLVRSLPVADSIDDLSSRGNVHWVQADIEDREAISSAVSKVSLITDGKLDLLIANAVIVDKWSNLDGLTELVKKDAARVEETLLTLFRVNVVAQIFSVSAFLPLIKAGTLKKVVAVSSGFANIDLTADWSLYQSPLYSSSKVGLNMAIAKLYAEHKDDGVLIMGIAPGVVATRNDPDLTDPETGAKAMKMFGMFMQYAPSFKGPVTPDQSAEQVLDVIEKATLERNGGKLVSQFGNEQWL